MNKEKSGFKEIIAYEKAKMLPLNFAMSYIITPIYAVMSIILIGTFAVLMEIDDQRFFLHGMLCLGAFVAASAAFLASVPLVRRKAINAELQRYHFDTSKEEPREQYDFSTEELSLVFDQYGLHVNDKLFYYSRLNKSLVISNDCKRIDLYVRFALSDEHYLMLYLDPTTLKMLECFEIHLDNQDKLDDILANPKLAFKRIYARGDKL